MFEWFSEASKCCWYVLYDLSFHSTYHQSGVFEWFDEASKPSIYGLRNPHFALLILSRECSNDSMKLRNFVDVLPYVVSYAYHPSEVFKWFNKALKLRWYVIRLPSTWPSSPLRCGLSLCCVVLCSVLCSAMEYHSSVILHVSVTLVSIVLSCKIVRSGCGVMWCENWLKEKLCVSEINEWKICGV